METILSYAENYLILSFIFLLISYLSPREEYRKYFQFFTGILLAVAVFAPLAELPISKENAASYLAWDEVVQKIEDIEYLEESEGMPLELFQLEEDHREAQAEE